MHMNRNFGQPSVPGSAEAMREIDDLVERAQWRYERFSVARSEIAEATATEHSPDGNVRATVRSTGALVDLTLTERTRSLPPSQVAGMVLTCVQLAQSRIADRVRAILENTVPGGDPLADELVTDTREQFPPPVARDVPMHEPGVGREDGDSDWGERSVLSR